MLYDWSMDSNHSTSLLGSKTDVVCARVGGVNTTPLLNSAVHFTKQKTYNHFLLPQNMNSVGKNERVPKPAPLPPPTRLLRIIFLNHSFFAKNSFDLSPKTPAKNQNRFLKPKGGRAEGTTLMHSP